MKKKTVILVVVALLAVLVLVPVIIFGRLFLWVIMSERAIDQKIADLSQPAVYEPVGEELARLCQSDPALFRNVSPFRPAWIPKIILAHDPTWVDIQPNGSYVEFGGGFHNFGYELTRSPGPTPTTHRWTLTLNDDGTSSHLYTFDLDQSEHVEKAQFIDEALAEFDRRIAAYPHGGDAAERTVFLLRLDMADKARRAIRESQQKYPQDWLDQLLVYIIAGPDDPDAAAELDHWAAQADSFTTWLFAAYAYHSTDDVDAMQRCVERALAAGPPYETSDSQYNARYRGMAMALHLNDAGKRDTCVKLCDALLRYQGAGDFLEPQLQSIRTGQPKSIDPASLFDPFDKIDLKKLREQ